MMKQEVSILSDSCFKVIGDGLIGRAFKKHIDINSNYSAVIFASGVSNSLETSPQPYLREKKLLESVVKQKSDSDKFIYFSTLSVYDTSKKDAAYIRHKRELEKYLIENCSNHIIIRVPNIIGDGGNPNTLLNYLIDAIQSNTQIKVFKNAYRNFIDVTDLVEIVEQLVISDTNNTIIDLLHPISYSMIDIMQSIEKHTNKKSNSMYVDEGYNYFPPPTKNVIRLFESSDISLNKSYLSSILKKYY